MQGETDLNIICGRLMHRALPTIIDTTVILIQLKHGAPDDAEIEEADDDEEVEEDIESNTSDDNEIKSAASDEQQPFAPNG